jgi:hypothetical protein
MTEREADAAAQSWLDALDLSKRLPRVRTFVIAILEDETGCRPADVIDLVVERLEAWLTLLRDRVAHHQNPPLCRMRTTWIRPRNSWWISRILPTKLFWP